MKVLLKSPWYVMALLKGKIFFGMSHETKFAGIIGYSSSSVNKHHEQERIEMNLEYS